MTKKEVGLLRRNRAKRKHAQYEREKILQQREMREMGRNRNVK